MPDHNHEGTKPLPDWMQDIVAVLHDTIYMPHIQCLLGDLTLVWGMIATDFLTGTSYMIISFVCWRQTVGLPPGMRLLFAAFVFWCGINHYWNIYVFFSAEYHSQLIIKAIMTAFSFVTAVICLAYHRLHPDVEVDAGDAALVDLAEKIAKERKSD